MAALARAAFPSTRRTPSTLPFSSTTSLRTTVPCASPDLASTGYFGATLCASRFSAPLEERMTALFSPGSSLSDGLAVTSFLSTGAVVCGLVTALLATGAGGTVLPGALSATTVSVVAAGWAEGTAAPATAGGVVDDFVSEFTA